MTTPTTTPRPCPFCEIVARAPPNGLNGALLQEFRRRRRDGGSSSAEAPPPPPPPPPLVVLGPPARLVYADHAVVALIDRSPAAEQHLLVLPRPHIPNVNTLLDAAAMAAAGERGSEPWWASAAGVGIGVGGDEEQQQEEEDNDDPLASPADLTEHMREVGEALLWQRSSQRRRQWQRRREEGEEEVDPSSSSSAASAPPPPPLLFGYHVPPWRSVDHLHLHAIEPPFRSSLLALKYRLEWLNWLPDDALRSRLRGGAAARRGGGRCCCWPGAKKRGGGSGTEPLVPPPRRQQL
jgi:hypothetical protein